jgi:hypothetical protein
LSWLKAQEKSGNLRLRRFPFFGVSFALSVAPEQEAVVTVGSVRDKIALSAGRRMRWGACGVVATATAVPVIPSGQSWPSSACGTCTSGTTPVVSDDICHVRHGCESGLVGKWLGAL